MNNDLMPAFERTINSLVGIRETKRVLEGEWKRLLVQLKEDVRRLPPGWEDEWRERISVDLGPDADAFFDSLNRENQ